MGLLKGDPLSIDSLGFARAGVSFCLRRGFRVLGDQSFTSAKSIGWRSVWKAFLYREIMIRIRISIGARVQYIDCIYKFAF